MILNKLAIMLVIAAAAALLGFYIIMANQGQGDSKGDSNKGLSMSSDEPSQDVRTNTPLPSSLAMPRIIVRKQERLLELYDGSTLIKTYKVGLGFEPVGDKQVEGDGRTPVGEFYIFVKNDKSKFTASLGLSYPNNEDAERGIAAGLITREEATEIKQAIDQKGTPPQKTRLGGEIYIHGSGSGTDWTWGCIALDDKDMLELFVVASKGMPVTILP